jgi:CBS domain-containing protein
VRARDLAAPFPTVTLTTSAIEAARLLAGQDLPGLIVVDAQGRPADVFLRGPGEPTVAQCLPAEHRELPVVDPDATVLEIAALIAGARSPLLAVDERGAGMLGAVTLDALLDRLVES